MKNIDQVKTIHSALTKEKEKLMSDLLRLNLNINKKMESVKKILAYYQDYSQGNHLSLSRSVPALNRNLDFFSNRMLEIIRMEENEIANLVKHRGSKLNEIEAIENKIRLMNHFADTIQSEMIQKSENLEQMTIDDLSVVKQTRERHE